jgi:1-deoxy-D-xylulose-5-phosphate synthase
MAKDHRLVVCIEDGVRVGGIGTRLRQDLRDAGVDTAVTELGLPDDFLPHGSRSEILELAGLTAKKISRDVVDQVLGNRIPIARPLPAEDTSQPDLRLVDTSDGWGVEGRTEYPL